MSSTRARALSMGQSNILLNTPHNFAKTDEGIAVFIGAKGVHRFRLPRSMTLPSGLKFSALNASPNACSSPSEIP
jgi:hypothetical protein